MSAREFIPNITPGDNLTPMLFPLPMRGANTGRNQPFSTIQPAVQVGFPFNVSQGKNVLLIPANERHRIRLLPTGETVRDRGTRL